MIFGSVRWRIASMTRRRIAASLTRGDDVPEVYRPEGAVESCGGNVVRPAIHRTIVVRYESAEGDPWSEKHLGTLLEVGVPNAASPEDQKTGDSHDTSPPRREPRCQIAPSQ